MSAALTPDTLRSLLSFDPETGFFVWKYRPLELFNTAHAANAWNARFAGKPALTADSGGYRQGHVMRHRIQAHRAAVIIVTGLPIPDGMQVDHINGRKHDNRIANLRLVTNAQNGRNRSAKRNPIYPGVHLRGSRFVAGIKVDYRKIHLGTFATADEAIAARKVAEAEHGFITRK